MNQQSSEPAVGNVHDDDYSAYLGRLQARFHSRCSEGSPVFQTDASGLWQIYLNSFSDPAERQHHNCHCCKDFIERFGGLAQVSSTSELLSAFWSLEDAPEAYKSAVRQMWTAVSKARITGSFIVDKLTLGTPQTGIWQHLSLRALSEMVNTSRAQTADQRVAEKREDFKTVCRALSEFTKPNLETTLTLLRADALYRSEKVLGQAEWLYELSETASTLAGRQRENAIWRAVAKAPAGFCHPRSSMIGTLLEDIAAGKDFAQVSRAFKLKMDPLAYQRPQAAPSAGTIEQAEKLVAKLGIERSLARRYVRLEEVQAIWKPAGVEMQTGGSIFGHLKAKGAEQPMSMRVPAREVTWAKFSAEVMPGADRIELLAQSPGNYTVLTTAVHADAPPILQWDFEEARNPVASYVWNRGSSASQYGLQASTYVGVEAICLNPPHWGKQLPNQKELVMFLLQGARETRQAGLALFPETLKAELHGVRAVIEAYSQAGKLEGLNEPHVVGLAYGGDGEVRLRAWVGNNSFEYTLIAWG